MVDQLWLYWQPLAPITFMIWLWGYNVHQFENLGVPYDICFSNRDRRFLLPADDVLKVRPHLLMTLNKCTKGQEGGGEGTQIWKLQLARWLIHVHGTYSCCNVMRKRFHAYLTDTQTALFFTSLVLSTAGGFCYCCLQGWHTAAQSMPVIAYMLVLMVLLLPVNMLNVNSRLFFASTLRRVLIPLQEVTWSDFLLADVLTSLSKCTSDIAKATCGLAAGKPSPCVHA